MKGKNALKGLELRAKGCRRCGLHMTRTNVVFGTGPVSAEVMLVGEGPGSREDLVGIPFVGAAGKKLDKLLKRASLRREDVYITNVVMCRPPGNRRPLPEEIEACRCFLEKRISIIKPKIIVALGRTAAEALLGGKVSMKECRGRSFALGRGGPLLFITYHPAAALYSGRTSRAIEEDFVKLGRLIRRHIGSPRARTTA